MSEKEFLKLTWHVLVRSRVIKRTLIRVIFGSRLIVVRVKVCIIMDNL